MSPANRCQTQAASEGASLAIDDEPVERVADEMHDTAPPVPRSDGRYRPMWVPMGSAHGFGVAASGPWSRIREAPTRSRSSERRAAANDFPVTRSAAMASSR